MRIIFLFVFILPVVVYGQFTYSLDQSVPVEKKDGTILPLAWAGGLNAVQTNTLDLNNDGRQDLVLFDRMGNKIITYLREEESFSYHPEYEAFFPSQILNWVLLRDFNCDGKKDLFTGDNLGMKVFVNTTIAGELPSWKPFYFSTGFGGKSTVLLSKSNLSGNRVNVQLQFDDLPSIADADGDGDLDLFTMRYAAGGQIEFHKNFSKERYNVCDSLEFERITQTWGNVRECSCGRFAFNGDDCSSGGRTKHAGGKSLLALDLDANNEPELLLSEAECSQLFSLANQGTLLAPIVNSASPFPPVNPAIVITYPSPYLEDIDGDGINDLMVSSNLFTREILNSEFSSSNLFYRNTGTNKNPQFTLVQRDFLQSEMIDVGDNSVPAFFDFDGDKDLDLFVSSHNRNGIRSPLSLYENTGSSKNPSFKLLSDDFLGFSFLNDFNRKIQFADMNNDHTMDLVFTSTSTSSGVTRLNFIANKSKDQLDLSDLMITQVELQLNRNDNVYVYDITGDGKNDLLVGRSDGAVELWEQTAPLTFSLTKNAFLGLDPSVLRQNVTFCIADLDADGKLDFVYGDQSGIIWVVSDFKNVADADAASISNIVYNELANNFISTNLGGRVWPTAVNLFGSSRPSLVVGNVLGGLQLLNSEGPELPDQPFIEVFPNPVKGMQTVSIKIDRSATVQLYSIVGQALSDPVRLQPFSVFETSFPALPPGMYILKFFAGEKTYSKKLIIDR